MKRKNGSQRHLPLLGEVKVMLDSPFFFKEDKKPIPKQFFEDYKFAKIEPVQFVLKHLAYAASIITTKEMFCSCPDIMAFDKMVHTIRSFVAMAVSKQDNTVKFLRPNELSTVAKQYIYEGPFDDTAFVMRPFANCYSIYCVLADMWQANIINDSFFIHLIDEMTYRMTMSVYKKDTEMRIGVFQYISLCIATDFLEQVSLMDCDCAEYAAKILRRLKQYGSFDFNHSPKCKRIGKKDALKIIHMMQQESYEVETHKDDGLLFQYKPYVEDETAKMLDIAEREKELYSAAVRQMFFATQTFTVNAVHMFEEIMYFSSAYEHDSIVARKHEVACERKDQLIASLQQEIKDSQSLIKKQRREIDKLTTQQVVGDTEKIATLEKRIESQREEYRALSQKFDEADRELGIIKNRDTRAKEKIESLKKDLAQQRTNNERLQSVIKQKDEIIEGLCEDLSTSIAYAGESADISTEDIEIAKKCEFIFFVPSFVNSTHLESYFPKSKFIKCQEDDTFEIGVYSKAAIVCTKGIAHGTFWRVEKHCERQNIDIVRVASYGLRTMFNAAINKYKEMNKE